MALYVCPAICDPEPYGVICDISISVCARHNLMQIAQILQVLAMYDDKEATKSQDLYSKFRSVSLYFLFYYFLFKKQLLLSIEILLKLQFYSVILRVYYFFKIKTRPLKKLKKIVSILNS